MALTAYMMLRKSQAFGFDSWEEGPLGWETLGLYGQQMMGPLIEPESRYNKVYTNTVLSPAMLTTGRVHSNGGLFATAAGAGPAP